MASLIRVGKGKTPIRAIQFIDRDGIRRTLRLGRVGRDDAERFKTKIEALLTASILQQDPDRETAAWLGSLSDRMHAKMSRSRLCGERLGMPLGEWLDKYIAERKPSLKPSSVLKLEEAKARLVVYFGEDRSLRRIALDDAAAWRASLAEKKLSEATIRKTCANAKLFFREAMERQLATSNPFRKLKSSAVAAKRDRFVTSEEAETILASCTSDQWKLLFGLARFAGLRVPSETHLVTWADVDWDKRRLRVQSPKTERYEGKEVRVVPIAPRLLQLLQDSFDAAEPGQERIIQLSQNNLRRGMRATIKRAGLTAWEDIFQTLRRSCATDLSTRHPAHAIAAWLGHSVQVARDHYLQVSDDMFEAVSGKTAEETVPAERCKKRCIALQKALKSPGAPTRTKLTGSIASATNDGTCRNVTTGSAGTRTQDPRLKRHKSSSPETEPNELRDNELGASAGVDSGGSAAKSAALPSESSDFDPELALIAEAWPDLPDAIRAGILAMIQASTNGERGPLPNG